MNSAQLTAFLQEHWNWVTLIIGAVLLIGAVMNWNWMCDPTGKPDSHRYVPAGACTDCGQHLEPRAGNEMRRIWI